MTSQEQTDISKQLASGADEALGLFAHGDPRDEVFEAALPQLLALIRLYLFEAGARRSELEDLAQDVVVRVYMKRRSRTGRGEASLRGWLRTVCQHQWISWIRKRNKTPRVPKVPEPPPEPDLRDALDDCVGRLPQRHQRLFLLRWIHEWSTERIAQGEDCSLRTCQALLQQARQLLQECLQRKGYE